MKPEHPRPALPPDLVFYASRPHPCSYLEGREAVTLFADPEATMSAAAYAELVDLGFRRSGSHVYRPHCPHCNACKAVRIPVSRFQPDRSQRRTARRNGDLDVTVVDASVDPGHFALYRRYMAHRHGGGGMDVEDPQQYRDFLISPWCDTRFVEFRLEQRLLAVAVVDCLPQGLSAVYTFFDPAESARGLGVQAVLWQVQEARRLNLPWVYLGYWIAESPKMAYKARYRPLEMFSSGRWLPVETEVEGLKYR